MIILVCANAKCGKSFEISRCFAKRRKFCCMTCRREALASVVTVTCFNPRCGKTFVRQAANLKTDRPCCSRRCARAIHTTCGRKKYTRDQRLDKNDVVTCSKCGKEYFRNKQRTLRTRRGGATKRPQCYYCRKVAATRKCLVCGKTFKHSKGRLTCGKACKSTFFSQTRRSPCADFGFEASIGAVAAWRTLADLGVPATVYDVADLMGITSQYVWHAMKELLVHKDGPLVIELKRWQRTGKTNYRIGYTLSPRSLSILGRLADEQQSQVARNAAVGRD